MSLDHYMNNLRWHLVVCLRCIVNTCQVSLPCEVSFRSLNLIENGFTVIAGYFSCWSFTEALLKLWHHASVFLVWIYYNSIFYKLFYLFRFSSIKIIHLISKQNLTSTPLFRIFITIVCLIFVGYFFNLFLVHHNLLLFTIIAVFLVWTMFLSTHLDIQTI
jgi:hypothetical protein